MIGVVALLAAQAAVEPPKTVNDIEIGTPEDFATPGPATVCIRDMAVSPREGETAYLAYSGIHFATIHLVLADGDAADFTLGENFIDLHKPGQGPMIQNGDIRVYFFEQGPEVSYQVHARFETDEGDRGWTPRVRVEGSALGGNRRDRDIFRRLSLDGESRPNCDRRYDFGWGVILEGDPIDATETQ